MKKITIRTVSLLFGVILATSLIIPSSEDENIKKLLRKTAANYFAARDQRQFNKLLIPAADMATRGNILSCAIRYGHHDILTYVIAKKNALAFKFEYQKTLLHLAALHSPQTVKLLLDAKADINACDFENKTPLNYAIKFGRVEVAQQLVENNADLEIPNIHGCTPLRQATELNDFESMQLLIDSKANIHTIANDQSSCLHWAARHCCDLTIAILIRGRADVNAKMLDGSTPLHHATYAKSEQAVRQLINAKAELNPRTQGLYTPLRCAVNEQNIPIIKLLLAAKTDPNTTSPFDQSTPLHIAAGLGNYEITESLLQAHANVHATDNDAQTPLHIAAIYADPALIQLLLDNKANLLSVDAAHALPSISAVSNNNHDTAVLLLDKTLTLDLTRETLSPFILHSLAYAIRDLQATDDKSTPIAHYQKNLAHLIEKNVVDVSQKNDQGLTYLDILKSQNTKAVTVKQKPRKEKQQQPAQTVIPTPLSDDLQSRAMKNVEEEAKARKERNAAESKRIDEEQQTIKEKRQKQKQKTKSNIPAALVTVSLKESEQPAPVPQENAQPRTKRTKAEIEHYKYAQKTQKEKEQHQQAIQDKQATIEAEEDFGSYVELESNDVPQIKEKKQRKKKPKKRNADKFHVAAFNQGNSDDRVGDFDWNLQNYVTEGDGGN